MTLTSQLHFECQRKMDDNISVIDCSRILGPFGSEDEEEFTKFTKEFGDALHGVGFAYVVNHGVDMRLVDTIYELWKEFFELPTEVKMKYKKKNPGKIWHGYSGPGDERVNEFNKNSTELREMFDIWGPAAFTHDGFPSEIPNLKEKLDALRVDAINFTKKLLRSLGKYLELDDQDFFVNNHRGIADPEIKTMTQFKTLYYFPMEITEDIPPNAIRCGEHTDWGTITLLFQDMIGGLEVKRTSGVWIMATPIKDAILINSGQLLELWSAGRLTATPHRVRLMDEERLLKNPRQSLIYFVNPDGDTEVKPIMPILEDKHEFARRPTLNAYEHYLRLMKNASAY